MKKTVASDEAAGLIKPALYPLTWQLGTHVQPNEWLNGKHKVTIFSKKRLALQFVDYGLTLWQSQRNPKSNQFNQLEPPGRTTPSMFPSNPQGFRLDDEDEENTNNAPISPVVRAIPF